MRIHVLLTFFYLSIPFCRLLAQDTQDKLELDKIYETTRSKRDSLYLMYETYSNQIDSATDTLMRDRLLRRLREIEGTISINKEDELKQEFEFIKSHYSSKLSLDILAFKIYKQEASKYYSAFTSLFNNLSPSLQNSEKGKQLRETLSQIKNSQVGNLAPAFTVKDINNEHLSLSFFRDKKYVLLDFWASWCVPCRQDFPSLIKIYEKYSTKGLEIISVSTDSEKDKWIAAIKKDSIGMWRHFSTKDNSNAIVSSYFVAAIPVKVLIDKEGRIVARWRGGGEENKESLERVLRDIFEKSS